MAERERIPAEILRKVRKIELSTRHMVDDLFGGEPGSDGGGGETPGFEP